MPQPERVPTCRWCLGSKKGAETVSEDDLKTDKASAEDVSKAEPMRWNLIDWEKVERHVNGLQTKIAQAQSEGKKEQVRKLQRLLVHSRDARLLAVRRVTSNKGKNTPGVDGALWNTPAKKLKAALSLTDKGYKAQPLRRVNIPKKGKKGKTRPLGIPTMHDRAMQALYALALEPVAEVTADRHSYGFRKGRSAQDASAQLFNVLSKKESARWVVEGDIKGCFDHISHEWLMENVPMDKKVLRQFLKAGYMQQGAWNATEEGTPQGGIISPILANMALDGIDDLLDERYHKTRSGRKDNSLAAKTKVNLTRYADDFVITAKTEVIAEEVRDLVAKHLSERGLELSEEKTLITHIDDGFDFLGWNFRKYKGKLIIKPSKESVNSFLRDVHRTILRQCGSWAQEDLIRILTPKIRGFAAYHRHICASKTFATVDNCIYRMLYRWAKRRHPNKSGRWRDLKYWTRVGSRRYIFGKADCYLPCMRWQHIVRHPVLRCGENPYVNPLYFEKRKRQLAKAYANSFRRAAV